jgi:hypothetical protein
MNVAPRCDWIGCMCKNILHCHCIVINLHQTKIKIMKRIKTQGNYNIDTTPNKNYVGTHA